MAGEQSGKDFLLYVVTALGPPVVWTLIGGQRGANLKRTNDTVDASHKTSGAWKLRFTGLKDWSISGDAVIIEDDAGMAALDAAFENSTPVQVRLNTPGDAQLYSGVATISDLSLATPHDGVATVSLELQAASPLVVTAGP